jgi:hypothetical protein
METMTMTLEEAKQETVDNSHFYVDDMGVFHVDKNVDMDVFDSARALVGDGVDLDDRAAVERAVINPYCETALSEWYVDWPIRTAKANLAAGGFKKSGAVTTGFVPPQHEAPLRSRGAGGPPNRSGVSGEPAVE